MGYAKLKEKAHDLFAKESWLIEIANTEDYKNALNLMDELVDDYEYNRGLIEVLAASIERWEDEHVTFKKFNQKISQLNSGVALFQVLMDQHHLGVADFPEIGSKSLVSKILNHQRALTVNHINALCKRFDISPELFFDETHKK